MVDVRIVSVLVLALLTLWGCGIDVDHKELSSKLSEFLEKGPEETRPFTAFTSWEWDTVKVVALESLDDEDVERLTGEDIDVPVSESGLFVYYKESKRVRAELVEIGAFCTGSYTRDAVVHRGYACWLRDDLMLKLPTK